MDACIHLGSGLAAAMAARKQRGQCALFGIQRVVPILIHGDSLARSLSMA